MIVYATDEDIALRASTDFSALCPRDQLFASGTDGSFASSDVWTLTSASVDFAAYGLKPGQLARLTKPTTAFGPNGELFAIHSVGTRAITLRRKGQEAGVGQPPSPQGGLTGVEFSVRSLGPQLAPSSSARPSSFRSSTNSISTRAGSSLAESPTRRSGPATFTRRRPGSRRRNSTRFWIASR